MFHRLRLGLLLLLTAIAPVTPITAATTSAATAPVASPATVAPTPTPAAAPPTASSWLHPQVINQPAAAHLAAAVNAAGTRLQLHLDYTAAQRILEWGSERTVLHTDEVVAAEFLVNGAVRATRTFQPNGGGHLDTTIPTSALPADQRTGAATFQAKLYSFYLRPGQRANRLATTSALITLPSIAPVQVTWAPNPLTSSLLAGTSQAAGVDITVSRPIPQATWQLSPSLSNFMMVPGPSPVALIPGAPATLPLGMAAPVTTPSGTYTGTLALVADGDVVSAVPVTIIVTAPSATVVPQTTGLPTPDRITGPNDGHHAQVVKDEMVVGLDQSLTNPDQRAKDIAAQTGAVILGSIPGLATYQLRYNLAGDQLDARRTALAALPGVSFAAHHYLGIDEAIPDDTEYPEDSWDPDATALENWGLRYINAPAAWDTTTGSANTRIGIIDSGFDRRHDDLKANVRTTVGFKQYVNTPAANWHGNHVAGTACAVGNNLLGVAGVNWHCSLGLYSPFTPYISQISDLKVMELMKQAVDDGMRVVNMSISWAEVVNKCDIPLTSKAPQIAQEVDQVLDRGILYGESRPQDVLWVFSAGNECRDGRNNAPANLTTNFPDHVLAVAATDHFGKLEEHSNYGPTVTIAAPGKDILSTINEFCGVGGCAPLYDYKTGTSMAAPMVTGVAGLVATAHPDFDATQIEHCLLASSHQTGRQVSPQAFGIIDAANAVTCSGSLPPCTFQADLPHTCQSADPHVHDNLINTGDTSSCTFQIDINWGDGATSDITYHGSATSGTVPLADHTYAHPGTYDILANGHTTTGSCSIGPDEYHFTLLPH